MNIKIYCDSLHNWTTESPSFSLFQKFMDQTSVKIREQEGLDWDAHVALLLLYVWLKPDKGLLTLYPPTWLVFLINVFLHLVLATCMWVTGGSSKSCPEIMVFLRVVELGNSMNFVKHCTLHSLNNFPPLVNSAR